MIESEKQSVKGVMFDPRQEPNFGKTEFFWIKTALIY